ncbi:MAG TPA: DUF2815 family protein [Candidatus Omnitrophota bacterium]|nr:DUF2815 family protein [Candidatus Omnitrophota bacterium]
MAQKKEDAAVVADKSALVVTKISPKGINAVIRNVMLNWVFIDKPAQDKDDPLKAAYRTQMVLQGGEKEFVAAMKAALTQYMKSAAISGGADVRMKMLNTALMLDVDKSLFKQTEQGLSLQAHQTVRRETDLDEFVAKYPPSVRLADNTDCPAGMIQQEFYSGAIADVAVFIAAYEVDAGRGITMYLNGVRKVADGERIASIDPFADVPPSTNLLENKPGKKTKGALL